jgi:hypothetical protein
MPSPLRHHLRVLGTPRPLLDPIKEKAEGSPEQGQTREEDSKTDVISTPKINISRNTPFYSFLETWDQLPLS